MSDLRAYILCRFAGDSGLYTSWMNKLSLPCIVVDEFLPDWHVPDDAGIVITHMHYRWEDLSALRKLLERNTIPILILSDGIIEYRNTWEHPELVDGSIFQPLFGHKLACIGRGQARIVESWGNAGKCEVVGLPRLDETGVAPAVNNSGPFRLLVATANTPAFDEDQRRLVVRALKGLKNWFSGHTEIRNSSSNRPIEVVWRLSDGLGSELEIGEEVDPDNDPRPPISDVIESVDAVITTPSTIYLESVLRKRPTALLDFHNSPKYFSAAWEIGSEDRIGQVVDELANPPNHKMLFQEFVLQDQLEIGSPATARMVKLINLMVEAGVSARGSHQTLKLPARILPDSQLGFSSVPESFNFESLYPDAGTTSRNEPSDEIKRLKIELAAAIKRLEQMPIEIAEKDRHIVQLNRMLDHARGRVEEMHNRVIAIRKRFGVEPEKPEVEERDS